MKARGRPQPQSGCRGARNASHLELPIQAKNGLAWTPGAQGSNASLFSVRTQNNDNLGIGPHRRLQDVRNIQPSSSVRVSEPLG